MQYALADAAATEALGAALAGPLRRACESRAVVLHLAGPLGAGKTTLVRGLLRGLGHRGRVRSPTFTLLEPYALPSLDVIHLDLYRLADPGELDYLGLLDMLGPGCAAVVEWAERGGDRLPGADLRLALDYRGKGRRALLAADTGAGRAILDALAESAPPDAPESPPSA